MRAGLSLSRRKPSRLLNLAMLIGGFGAGQGSIFVAQTWLIAHGKLPLLALFGTHFSFAMIGIIFVEAGSITILARKAASTGLEERSGEQIWRSFAETSIFRVAMAILITVAAITSCAFMDYTGFTRNFIIFSAPAFLVWSLNAAGLLDGFKLSGISGLTGSIAYLTSALGLFVSMDLSNDSAGGILGAAFTLGYFLTVLAQVVALRRVGAAPRFVRPSVKGTQDAAYSGLAMLGSSLPGQIYFRAQLLISTAWLGSDLTGLFVYVKQIISALIQVIGFVRRVEFPDLVTQLARDPIYKVGVIFQAQRTGTLFALCATGCVIVGGIAINYIASGHFSQVGEILSVFAVTIISSTIALTLNQGLAAIGRFNQMMLASVLALVAGVTTSFCMTPGAGVASFAIGDVAANVVNVIVALTILRKRS